MPVSDIRAAGLNMLTRESAISFFIKGPGFITFLNWIADMPYAWFTAFAS